MARYRSDILTRNLDVLFCGLNPGESAAADGHNFSNRSNRFWPVLHLAGFTDVRLRPQDERRVLEYGCGLNAVIASPTTRADEISADEFRQARPEFEVKMRRRGPRVVVSERAWSADFARAAL